MTHEDCSMEDPIVAEVRATRYALFSKHGDDLAAWHKSIQESGIAKNHTLATLLPQRPLERNNRVLDPMIPTTPAIS